MKISDIIVLRWNDSAQMYVKDYEYSYEYDGLVASAKKGRESEQQVTRDDLARAKTNDAYTAEQRGGLNKDIALDETNGQPGQLAPAASAQLANDQNNIAGTYKGLRETAYGSLGQRGFGSAPSGFEKSISNGLDLGQQNADTGAFRNAQITTQNLADKALAARTNQANTGVQAAQSADNGGGDSAFKQSQMGSTAGDVLGAVAQIAPIAAAIPTGGASLLGMGAGSTNPFAKLGQGGGKVYGNGVSGYAGSSIG